MRRRSGAAVAEAVTVSYSQLASFRDCPAKWGFRYGEGLVPKDTPEVLVRGRVFHAGLTAGYRARQAGERTGWTLEGVIAAGVAAADAEWKRYEQERGQREGGERDDALRDVERWMVEHHFGAMAAELAVQVPVLIEHRVQVPIPNRAGRAGGLYLVGDLDLVTYDRRYDWLVLHEHKSTALTVDTLDRRLELDPQTAGYVHALRHELRSGKLAPIFWRLGIEVAGTPEALTGQVAYNVSRRKKPSEPHVNKDGTVSTAACDTTPALMREALAAQHARYEAGEAPDWLHKYRAIEAKAREKCADAERRWQELLAKQGEQLARLEQSADPFFRSFEYRRTDEEIERWREEAWIDAGRIRDARRDPRKRTRNPGNCATRGCEFFDVCLRPEDATIRDAQFTTRAAREAEKEAKQNDLDAEPGVGF